MGVALPFDMDDLYFHFLDTQFILDLFHFPDSIGFVFSFHWGPGDVFLNVYNITLFTISNTYLLTHADQFFLFFQNYIFSCSYIF
jgi:hypothetical protein